MSLKTEKHLKCPICGYLIPKEIVTRKKGKEETQYEYWDCIQCSYTAVKQCDKTGH